MRTFAKPRVVVSRCLEFAACRYDGAMISDEWVRRLKDCVDFLPVCPEMEIGLGCPRPPIRVVISDSSTPSPPMNMGGEGRGEGGTAARSSPGLRPPSPLQGEGHHYPRGLRLVQPSSGRDVTGPMATFAAAFVAGLGPVDGFLLKARSPSCGLKDVKVYAAPDQESPSGTGRGLFAQAAVDRYPDWPAEDEGRLKNFLLREHFLTRLFTLADFRRLAGGGTIKDLVRFHAVNKGLLMAYHQAEMRAMGRVVANHDHRPDAEVIEEYGHRLARALLRPPRFTSIINVLMHALGYVSDRLSSGEKAFFLDALEKYRAGKVPLSSATTLVKAWAVRFAVPALSDQTYLEPYPEALLEITDSGKGRDA
jgi:uncharacterized protein YbgA (DUF1722 family)/uncharacterized protein YbbK (DUF523 family)